MGLSHRTAVYLALARRTSAKQLTTKGAGVVCGCTKCSHFLTPLDLLGCYCWPMGTVWQHGNIPLRNAPSTPFRTLTYVSYYDEAEVLIVAQDTHCCCCCRKRSRHAGSVWVYYRLTCVLSLRKRALYLPGTRVYTKFSTTAPEFIIFP